MKKNFILLPLVAALCYIIFSSSMAGPGGILIPPSGGGCSCHSGSPISSTTISMQLLTNPGLTPVTAYAPGNSYFVRITGTNTSSASLTKFGWQVGVLNSSLTSAGTLTSDGFSHTVSGGGVTLLEHNAPQNMTSGSGTAGTTYVRTFAWAPPVAGTGTITLSGIINAVNGDNGSANDRWNSGTANIPELAQITGPASVCVTGNISLADATAGGAWSSSNTAIGTVSSTGVVTGMAAGTTTISYQFGGSYVTKIVTVNANPGTFGGTPVVCMTQTTTLTNSEVGGTWSNGGSSVASIVSGTGIVTGLNAGTALMTYAIGTCSATTTVTVNSLLANTGTPSVCVGNTTALANPNGGGAWSSSTPAVGTVSSSGVVQGISAGTTTISYTLPISGCRSTTIVTVNSTPAAIDPIPQVCVAGTVTATNSVFGGTWSTSAGSGSLTIVGTSGVITGSTAGTANVTYTLAGGCFTTGVATINPLPSSITGTTTFCANGSTTLNSTPSGGTWTSNNAAIAVASPSTGVITGGGPAGGGTLITYTLPTGCLRTAFVNVNAMSPVSGTLTLCQNATTALASAPGSGTWTSGATSVASVNATTGSVAGLAAGTAAITYAVPSGCQATAVVTVNENAAITGGGSVCTGNNLSLFNTVAGGTWSSSNTSVGTISTGGSFAGLANGTSTVAYTTAQGCVSTTIITVNAAPGAVTGSGAGAFCGSATIGASGGAGGTIYYQGTAAGGTSTAIPSTSQIVTSSGTYYFRVQSSLGCWGPEAAITVTVNPNPTAISGIAAICVGSTATLNSTPAGGTWSSSNTAVGTVSGTGAFTSLSSGTTTIVYTTAAGCTTSGIVTVNVAPGAVTGLGGGVFCGSAVISASGGSGGTIFYQGTTAGGTSAAIAATTQTVTATGTYYFRVRSIAGCWGPEAAINVTVNPIPTAITGAALVCAGATSPLTSTPTGGTWSSSDIAKGTIDATTGVFTGIAAGTTAITYSASGCTVSRVVTVQAAPAAVLAGGGGSFCTSTTITAIGGAGGTIFYQGATSGGTSISTPATSQIVTSSGTYYFRARSASGCWGPEGSATVTINAVPAPISGPSAVCVGGNGTLSSTTSGGTWASSNTSIATIGSASGIVSGVSTGTTTITYTNTTTGCFTTRTLSVTALPGAISGTFTVCATSATSLSASPAGGTWASSNTSVASVGSLTGTVSGVDVGTSTITYTLGTGCSVTADVSVNPLPAAITGGNVAICVDGTATLSNTTSGGAWNSGTSAVASVDASGVVTGITSGATIVSYTLSTGCRTTTNISVNPLPTPITGTLSPCVGQSGSLTSTPAGGTWSSANNTVAAIGASSGVLSAIATGASVVSYTLSTGCARVVTVNVNPLPSGITGAATTCVGVGTTLSAGPAGGTWSSSNTSVATVNATTGVVTGAGVGTATISYSVSSGCFVTTTVSINSAPTAGTITGSSSVCAGLVIPLASSVSGGTWSSSDDGIATVDASGSVTGVAAGVVTISYAVMTSCGLVASTKNISVTTSAVSGAITGPSAVCIGATATLSSTVLGGSWTSGTPGIAAIGASTGVVSGIAIGTSSITYTISSSCGVATTTTVISVNPLPSSISGASSVCVNATATLSNTGGGTWSSSDESIADADEVSGIITGVNAGSAIITYTLPTGCRTTRTMNVLPLPAPTTGTLTLCAGATTTLSNATGGGTWSSSNTSVATIGSTSGFVIALSSGATIVNYTSLSTGCARSAVLNINPNPSNITGTANVCVGSATSLSNASTGGVWSSGSTSVASIDATSGTLTGVNAGTAIVTYQFAVTGCRRTTVATVNALPGIIGGTASTCPGASTLLTNAMFGGTWSSSDATIAAIGSATGLVTGGVSGTVNVTYTSAAGCIRTSGFTVYSAPAAITGPFTTCAGSSATLANATSGGSWSSSNSSVATITGAGVFTGVVAGTTTISYMLATGCYTTTVITVNALPTTIGGSPAICNGDARTFASAPLGGVWSSSTSAVASIGASSGVANALSAGASVITYELATGCKRTLAINVNPLPAAITGTMNVCVGAATTLANVSPGGSWTTAATGIATIGATTGGVTGISPGTANVSYSFPTGCRSVATVTVNALPANITGASTVCLGASVTLSNATGGGSWSSSNPTIGSVAPATGVVAGITPGATLVSYVLPTGCLRTTGITVNALPDAGNLSGAAAVCVGATIPLVSTVSGGFWGITTGKVSVSALGVVTGLTNGADTIRYSVTNVCGTDVVTHPIIVNPLPFAGVISGPDNVCMGGAITLSTTGSGGGWSSNNTSIATVSGFGVVMPVTPGGITITYSVTNACGSDASVKDVTVYPAVDAGTLSGDNTLCVGNSILLEASVADGTWASSNTTVAFVNSDGVVTGINAGIASIRYTVTNACSMDTISKLVTVQALADCETYVPSVAKLTIGLYPNPTNGTFTIEVPAAGKLSVIAIDGREVYATLIKSGLSTISLPAGVASGVYLCKFSNESGAVAIVNLVYAP